MGECDHQRYRALDRERRDYLTFAAEFAEDYLRRRPLSREALAMAAASLTALGFYEDGLRYDQRLVEISGDNPHVLYNCACSLALTANLDGAFAQLERAIQCGFRDADLFHRDPDWKNARRDPRFRDFLRRLAALAPKKSAAAPVAIN